MLILALAVVDDLRDGEVLEDIIARAQHIPVEERPRGTAIPIDKGVDIAHEEVQHDPSEDGV